MRCTASYTLSPKHARLLADVVKAVGCVSVKRELGEYRTRRLVLEAWDREEALL